jgi:3'-5' exoribonuclease
MKARESVTRAGKPFLELEISDGTATEKFKIWEDNDAYDTCNDLQDGDCVKIEASFFRNQYGMNVDGLRLRWLEKKEIADLFGGTPERRAALERDWEDVQNIIGGLKDPRLRALCQTYLTEYDDRFRRAAAARDYHHARRGGLLEHTAQMLRSGSALSHVYQRLNWDLVLAGVLFHDAGKLWELDYQPQGFVSPMTTMGELLGHITIGIELVNKLWRGLETTPEFTTDHQPPRENVPEGIRRAGHAAHARGLDAAPHRQHRCAFGDAFPDLQRQGAGRAGDLRLPPAARRSRHCAAVGLGGEDGARATGSSVGLEAPSRK